MQRIDITGEQYGLWTALEPSNQSGKWKCQCVCGTIKDVYTSNLRSGKTHSCGCHAKSVNSARMSTHNESKSKLYGVWLAMRRRCYLKTTRDYENWGGRGIKVCDEWQSYEPFRDWAMTNGYQEGLTLDRKDNDKDYSPDNCRWVNRFVQSNNKRNNHFVEINGEIHTIAEWCRLRNIKKGAFQSRLKLGWTGEKLLAPSKIGNNQFTKF